MIEISPQHIALMQRVLGISKTRRIPYRSYHTTDGEHKEWEELIKQGFAAKRHSSDSEYIHYYVTKSGENMAINSLPEVEIEYAVLTEEQMDEYESECIEIEYIVEKIKNEDKFQIYDSSLEGESLVKIVHECARAYQRSIESWDDSYWPLHFILWNKGKYQKTFKVSERKRLLIAEID